MELFGTAPSPFTRKVRIALLELGLDHDFKIITELLGDKPEFFAQNPLLQLPILVDKERRIFDSALICQYLIEQYGSPQKPLVNLPSSPDKYKDLQRLIIINGGMDAGVKIVRAKRSEIPDFDSFAMFKQERAAVQDSLRWLDQDLAEMGEGQSYYPKCFSILEVSLQCYLDWALFRNIVPSLDPWPRLKRFNHYHQSRPSLYKTHPVHGA